MTETFPTEKEAVTVIRKGSLIALVVIASVYMAFSVSDRLRPQVVEVQDKVNVGEELLQNLYHDRKGGVQVQGFGTVARILPDDIKGSRHQRFIVELSTGQTLLIAHNIDLAPRIDGLRTGDRVEFSGEYEWNPEGGVIHWTHRDPSEKHSPGWLEHKGQRYW